MKKNKKNKFAMINYKGGTGKTCTLVNLAHAISKKGHKVVIVDTDPQGSVSYHLGIKPKKTLYDVIVKRKNPLNCVTEARKNLSVLASNERLYPVEHFMHQNKNRESILSDCLSPLFESYDYVLIDCAPSMTLMNQNVLLMSQQLLVPVSMEYMTLLGLKQLIENINLLNKSFKKSIKISKIIPTFFSNNNKKTKTVYNSLSRVFSDYLSPPIRINGAISEASGQGKTIYEYNSTGQSIKDFNKLTEEVLSL